MKNILGILLLFFSAFMLTNCEKENLDMIEIEEEEITVDTTIISNNLIFRSNPGTQSGGLELDCITILYPFDLLKSDGTTISINNDDDFLSLIDSTATGSDIIDFVYPLDVLDDEGEQETIDDAEELAEMFAECVPDGGWTTDEFPAYLVSFDNSCYTLQYPLTLETLDGTELTANDEEDFIELMTEEIVFFVFPFNVIHEDGNTETVNDVDELFSLLISCNGFYIDSTDWEWETGFEYIGCYMIGFPLDVVVSDGSVVTVNNHMELCDLMLVGELVDYAYPLILTDEDGNTVIANNEDELYELLEDCDDFISGSGDAFLLFLGTQPVDSLGTTGCYTINYPITVTGETATGVMEIEIFSDQEILELSVPDASLEYPVSVTLTSDGSVVELNGIEEIFELLEDCF
ncbi:MAG: hypothetical protein HKO89_02100 [Saprospiraceae bacterium]|nr:hypothetical protein [Saprospiraceae bacterium]